MRLSQYILIGLAMVLVSCQTTSQQAVELELISNLNAHILSEQMSLRLIANHLNDLSPDKQTGILKMIESFRVSMNTIEKLVELIPKPSTDKVIDQATIDALKAQLKAEADSITELSNALAAARENW